MMTAGKFETFKELLDEILEAGEKVVVFSQYLEMLDLIEAHLREKGVAFAGLRGKTIDRRGELRRFQEDPSCRVFVGSLLAGGLGIDLTAASVVVHYDRWWNAAREDQATDRVHRIGQARGVQVWKLLTHGTIEERIDRIIRDKRALLESVVEADENAALKILSREELIELLSPAK
jgi:SNF2 family DNA or RNA helicase